MEYAPLDLSKKAAVGSGYLIECKADSTDSSTLSKEYAQIKNDNPLDLCMRAQKDDYQPHNLSCNNNNNDSAIFLVPESPQLQPVKSPDKMTKPAPEPPDISKSLENQNQPGALLNLHPPNAHSNKTNLNTPFKTSQHNRDNIMPASVESSTVNTPMKSAIDSGNCNDSGIYSPPYPNYQMTANTKHKQGFTGRELAFQYPKYHNPCFSQEKSYADQTSSNASHSSQDKFLSHERDVPVTPMKTDDRNIFSNSTGSPFDPDSNPQYYSSPVSHNIRNSNHHQVHATSTPAAHNSVNKQTRSTTPVLSSNAEGCLTKPTLHSVSSFLKETKEPSGTADINTKPNVHPNAAAIGVAPVNQQSGIVGGSYVLFPTSIDNPPTVTKQPEYSSGRNSAIFSPPSYTVPSYLQHTPRFFNSDGSNPIPAHCHHTSVSLSSQLTANSINSMLLQQAQITGMNLGVLMSYPALNLCHNIGHTIPAIPLTHPPILPPIPYPHEQNPTPSHHPNTAKPVPPCIDHQIEPSVSDAIGGVGIEPAAAGYNVRNSLLNLSAASSSQVAAHTATEVDNPWYPTDPMKIESFHYPNPYNKKNLNFIATKILHDWYAANVQYPYPSNDEVQRLALAGRVTEAQVSSCFALGLTVVQITGFEDTHKVRKWLANRRLRTGNTYRYNNLKRRGPRDRKVITAQNYAPILPSPGSLDDSTSMFDLPDNYVPSEEPLVKEEETAAADDINNNSAISYAYSHSPPLPTFDNFPA